MLTPTFVQLQVSYSHLTDGSWTPIQHPIPELNESYHGASGIVDYIVKLVQAMIEDGKTPVEISNVIGQRNNTEVSITEELNVVRDNAQPLSPYAYNAVPFLSSIEAMEYFSWQEIKDCFVSQSLLLEDVQRFCPKFTGNTIANFAYYQAPKLYRLTAKIKNLVIGLRWTLNEYEAQPGYDTEDEIPCIEGARLALLQKAQHAFRMSGLVDTYPGMGKKIPWAERRLGADIMLRLRKLARLVQNKKGQLFVKGSEQQDFVNTDTQALLIIIDTYLRSGLFNGVEREKIFYNTAIRDIVEALLTFQTVQQTYLEMNAHYDYLERTHGKFRPLHFSPKLAEAS